MSQCTRHVGPTSGQIPQALECACQATRDPSHYARDQLRTTRPLRFVRRFPEKLPPLTAHGFLFSRCSYRNRGHGRSAPTISSVPINRPPGGRWWLLSHLPPFLFLPCLLHRALRRRCCKFRKTLAGLRNRHRFLFFFSSAEMASPPRGSRDIAAPPYDELLRQNFLRLVEGTSSTSLSLFLLPPPP